MAEIIFKNNLNVVLIQVDEAHSTAWPLAIDSVLNVEQPEPQKTYQDRINRANYFVTQYNPPFDVYIDGWDNTFAELFRAWPDKYHLIDSNMKIIAKSEYAKSGENEAKVLEDYTVLLQKLINKMQ